MADSPVFCRIHVLAAPFDILNAEHNRQYIPELELTQPVKRRRAVRRGVRDGTPESRDCRELVLRLDPAEMKYPDRGHIFGSARTCDILLDSNNDRSVSAHQFSLKLDYERKAPDLLQITNLSQTNRTEVGVQDSSDAVSNFHFISAGMTANIRAAGVSLSVTLEHATPFVIWDNFRESCMNYRISGHSAGMQNLNIASETPCYRHDSEEWTRLSSIPWHGTEEYKMVSEILGVGSTCTVRKAWRQSDKQTVALKIIADGARSAERRSSPAAQIRELNVMLDLKHENIVQLLDHARWDNATVLVLEFAPHGTLSNFVHGHKLDSAQAGGLLNQILRGAQYLHSHNIIHRDINLENILMFNVDTECLCCKLADFTHAREVTQGNLPSDIVGTLAYMSPECARGLECDHRTDIYAIGKVGFRLLTGHFGLGHKEEPPKTPQQLLQALKAFEPNKHLAQEAVPEDCRLLIKAMLGSEQSTRPSAAKCLRSAWFLRSNNAYKQSTSGASSAVGTAPGNRHSPAGRGPLSLSLVEEALESKSSDFDETDDESHTPRASPFEQDAFCPRFPEIPYDPTASPLPSTREPSLCTATPEGDTHEAEAIDAAKPRDFGIRVSDCGTAAADDQDDQSSEQK